MLRGVMPLSIFFNSGLVLQMLKSLSVILFSAFSFFLNVFGSPAYAGESYSIALFQELSSRHPSYSVTDLVSLAGSEDELVSQLLMLRLIEKPSNVSVNAEKALVSFSHRPDVREAFLEDVVTEERLGLGSVILSRLDEVEDRDFAYELAKKALDASKDFAGDPGLRYRVLLRESSSPGIRSLLGD
jgi:hypothetical protein